MKTRSSGFVRRIRAGDSAIPRPHPSGGQAPALHSPIPTPPRMTNSALGPTGQFQFRINRSSRLPPAHQGIKTGAPVGGSSIRCLGTWVGCRTAGSGGPAPALHSFILPSAGSLQFFLHPSISVRRCWGDTLRTCVICFTTLGARPRELTSPVSRRAGQFDGQRPCCRRHAGRWPPSGEGHRR